MPLRLLGATAAVNAGWRASGDDSHLQPSSESPCPREFRRTSVGWAFAPKGPPPLDRRLGIRTGARQNCTPHMAISAIRLNAEWLAEGQDRRLPLVLLHGFTGDATTWQYLLPHLGDERPVLALDLIGHGRSEAPDDVAAYTMPAAVEQIARTLAGVGLARAHWLGYSMGGRVALQLALAHPALVASLVLVGASPGLDDPAARAARRREDEALAAFIEREGIEAFVDRWMALPLFDSQKRLGPEYLARARAQRLRNRPAALARSLRGMGAGAMAPVTGRLGAIEAPVLVAAGADDEKFSRLAGEMVNLLPAARLMLVPAVGHAVHVEAPEELGRAVNAFLRDERR